MLSLKVLASGSAANCYHLTDGITNILIECGLSFKEIQRETDFVTMDCVILSHAHL